MTLQTLSVDVSPRCIATITLNRPDRGNAFDQTMLDELAHELKTLGADANVRIVMLRGQVDRATQIRLQEGVVTASDYLDRNAELLQARFARAGHEVELAQASAHLLTTLGLEVR